jgi:hypothetical protein
MRLKEQQLRETLERALHHGKDLGDHVHYDQLAREASIRCEALIHDLLGAVDQHLEVLSACALANHQLRRECETLQKELDHLEGRPPEPDLFEAAEPVLRQLSAEQVAALRYVCSLESEPAPPAPDSTEVFAKGQAYVQGLEQQLAEIRSLATRVFEVLEEKVRRGWMPQSEIDSRKPGTEEGIRKMDELVELRRDFLRSCIEDRDALLRRRDELRQALARVRTPEPA